jgi:hypothetical protein
VFPYSDATAEKGILSYWDTRQECVVCGTVYVTQRKAQGLDSLIPVTPSGSTQKEVAPSNVPVEGSNATVKGKEKALDEPEAPVVRPVERFTIKDNSQSAMAFQVVPSASLTPPNPAFSEVRTWLYETMTLKTHHPHLLQPISALSDILATSDKALGVSLSALSQRLLLLSGQPILDPIAISQTADAIARTGQALGVINTLRRNHEQ